MNPHQIKRLFPGASASLLAANAGDYDKPHDPNTRTPIPDTKPERHQATALVGPVSGKEESSPLPIVRFTGFRVRPLDPDNFAGSVKDLLDGLRHAELLEGDEPWRIVLQTEQVKVATFKEEKTEIRIIRY